MKKNININKIKFLIDRVESARLTLNEYNEKYSNFLIDFENKKNNSDLLTEGAGVGGVLKYIDNALKNLNSVKGIDLNNLEKIRGKLTKLRNSVDSKLKLMDDFVSTKGLDFPDAADIRIGIDDLIREYIRVIPFDNRSIDAKKLTDHILGISDADEFLRSNILSIGDLDYIDFLKDMASQLNSWAEFIDNVSPVINSLSKSNGFDNFFKRVITSGNRQYKSLKEIEDIVIGIEKDMKILDSDGDDIIKVKNAYNTAKKRSFGEGGIDVNSVEEMIESWRQSYLNSTKFKIAKKRFFKKWKETRADKKASIQIPFILKQLKKHKKIDWNKTIIYLDPNTKEIILITFKSDKQFKKAKEALKSKGVEFETPMNPMEGARGVWEANERATRRKRNFKIILWIAGASIAGGAVIWCAVRYGGSMKLSEEVIERAKEFDEMTKDGMTIDDMVEEESGGWFWDLVTCGSNTAAVTIAVAHKQIKREIVGYVIIPYKALMVTIIKKMDEICTKCKCNLECDDKVKINTWVEEQKDDTAIVGELEKMLAKINNLKETIGATTGWDSKKIEGEIRKIQKLAGVVDDEYEVTETNLGGLTIMKEDGKLITLAEVVAKACKEKENSCLEKDVNTVLNELSPNEENKTSLPKTCEGIKTWQTERMNKLKYWFSEGKIFVGNEVDLDEPENKDKVVLLISELKKIIPFKLINGDLNDETFMFYLQQHCDARRCMFCVNIDTDCGNTQNNDEEEENTPNNDKEEIVTIEPTWQDIFKIEDWTTAIKNWVCEDGKRTEIGQEFMELESKYKESYSGGDFYDIRKNFESIMMDGDLKEEWVNFLKSGPTSTEPYLPILIKHVYDVSLENCGEK